MRIGIDARTVNVYPGMGRYCMSLIKSLAKIDHENKYVIFKTPKASNPLTYSPNFTEMIVNIKPLSIGTVIAFSDFLKKANLDVFLATFYIAPWYVPCKMVLTVNDMMDRSFPQMFSHHPFPKSYCLTLFYRLVVGRALKNACRVIAISHFTKREILRYYNLPEERIKVIYDAADEHFRPVEDMKLLEGIREKYHLPSEYVLFVGTTKYYKNLHRLIESFSYVMKDDFSPKPKLIIAGMKDVLGSELEQLTKRLKIEEDVLFIGSVEENDLPSLYSGAKVFILPSLYEGFGLTALEAMACGTPVIASNISALPEVVDDGGILIDPLDTKKMAFVLKKLLMEEDFQKSLSLKGLRQAKNFSWEKTAIETLSLLKDCAGEI
jgi:glycosyltransferase involved in cell wall biosynthesis